MNRKLYKTLESVERATPKDHEPIYGLAFPPYPGVRWDMAPRQLQELLDLGYIEQINPHNSAHYDYACITKEGREALKQFREKETPHGQT